MIRRISIAATCITLFASSSRAFAQPNDNPNAPTTAAAEMPIEHGMRLLANVRDNVLSFDDPGFYWFCRFVTTPAGKLALEGATGSSSASESTSHVSPAGTLTPIKFLLERPSDYRGKPVLIEGTVVAKTSWTVDNRDVPNPLHQCEIAVAGTRALAAVVTPEPLDAIPIRSRVRVKGYFIKVRAFQTTSGEPGAGPLLVARRVSPIATADALAISPDSGASAKSTQMWILTGTLIAAVVWLTIRRRQRIAIPASTRGASTDKRTAPASSSDDDFDWMTGKPD